MNEVIKQLDHKFHHRPNVIKVSKHEKLQHFIAKCLIVYELMQNGNNVYTEAIFSDGRGRADIINIETKEVIEILCSETEDMVEKKIAKYPFPIIPIKSKDILNHWKEELYK